MSNLLNFHLSGSKEKKDKARGLSVAKTIQKAYDNAYYASRNAKFKKNRDFSRGKQPMREFLDLMNIDGKESFTNLDMKAPAIAPKFVQVILNGFLKRDEKPRATAIDPVSVAKKQIDRDEAEFRMTEGAAMKAMEDNTGMKLMADNQYTPEDYEELDLFFGLHYQQTEEILFEKGMSAVLYDNNWYAIKRKLLEDLIEVGMAGTKLDVGENGKLKLRRVIPENMVYGHSDADDFRDCTFMGEITSIKISQLRLIYPNIEEFTFFEIAKKSKAWSNTIRWNDSYTNASDRPYDDYNVDVLEFEVKSSDDVNYVTKITKNGHTMVDRKSVIPTELPDNKSVITKQVGVVYEGCYVLGTETMLKWEVSKNMIKPSTVKELASVEMSYSLYMYENLDMNNMALVERMESSIRQMSLCHLKIQQLVAKMRPSGLMVDISGMGTVKLGNGKNADLLMIQRIYDQTGNLYFNRLKDDGETQNAPPIQELPNNGSVQQISSLIELYNFYLNRLRDEIGVNEVRDGSGINPRLGLGVAQNQLNSSNNATDFLYDGFLDIYQKTCKKMCMKLYDSVMYGGKQYSEYLGEKDVNGKVFDVKIEVLPDEQEKQFVDGLAQTALSAGLVEFDDIFRVRHIDNIKLKELFLAKARKKKEKEKQIVAQQNSEMNAQIQERSMQAKSQGDAQLAQLQSQSKSQVVQLEKGMDSKISEQNFIQNLLLKSFETRIPLSGEFKMLVDKYLGEKFQAEQMQQMQAQQQASQEQYQNASPEEQQMMENQAQRQQDEAQTLGENEPQGAE